MRNCRPFLAILAALCAASASGADGLKVTTDNDLVYTKAGGDELKLDMARPAEGDGPFPAIVVIHGGGWRAGTRPTTGRSWPSSPGGVTWRSRRSIGSARRTRSRRRSTTSRRPSAGSRAHAEEYKVDADHIGAVGLLGRRAPVADARPDRARTTAWKGTSPADAPDSQVQAVVNYFGPTDLAADRHPRGHPAAGQGLPRRLAQPRSPRSPPRPRP